MYYLYRIKALGFSGLKQTLLKRLQSKVFKLKNRLQKKSSVFSRYKITQPFDRFLDELRKHNRLDALLNHELWKTHCSVQLSSQELIAKANDITAGNFEIFGTTYNFKNQIPWHHDFRIRSTYFEQFKNTFYQNIIVKPVHQETSEDLPDIKIPWELSRLQHFFILGAAYRQTKSEMYAQTFARHVTNWIDNNPYLFGINWRCPMEVAIRAVNLVWGFHFFKHENTLSADFFEKLISSLLEHHEYLSWNWETSDKPNNHYIADLVGYLYLTLLFVNIKNIYQQLPWCMRKLQEQLSHQIQPDGSSYEGSTAYHRLDTEMFLHVQMLCDTHNVLLPHVFRDRIKKMLYFLQSIHDQNSNLVQIGDNDSGKFCTGITSNFKKLQALQEQTRVQLFANFGLSVITNHWLHATFRHPRFEKHQPSGHFHHDELEITLSINGIQLFIDPGSYLYTGNPWWRNCLRSTKAHSTFLMHSNRSNETSHQDLFQLNRKQSIHEPRLQEKNGKVILEDFSENNELKDTFHHRKIVLNEHLKEMIITDWVTSEKTLPDNVITWTFVCGPGVEPCQESDTEWILIHSSKKIALLQTSLPLTKKDGYWSPGYAERATCTLLTATIPATSNKYQTIISTSSGVL